MRNSPQLSVISSQFGFTLVEIIVSVGILAMLGSLGLFLGFDAYSSSALNSEQDELVAILKRAKSQSLNNISSSSHGVHLANGLYVIFNGQNYTSADINNKNFDGSIIVSHQPQNLDIVFQPLSGSSNYSGNISLNIGSKNQVININSEGDITW